MTDFDRLERRLPDLMAELSPPSIPDYFDDMLRATARTRQRPAWADLERWLPMELTARPAPFGLASWRPVLTMLVIVALLLAAGAVLLAGTKRSLPPLFGPARNGAVIYGDAGGDILSLDPATGKAVPIIGGATDDRYPTVSPDGQRILFVRFTAPAALYTANIDGSNIQAVASEPDSSWNDWSPNGQRLVYIADGGGTPNIRDVTTGNTATLPVKSAVHAALWLTNDKLLLIEEPTSDGLRTFWTINADGSDQRLLTTPNSCCSSNVLPGSNLLAWTSWDHASDTAHGRIHVLDISTGSDKLLASTDKDGLIFMDPRFSPDGKWILVNQLGGTVTGGQPALIAADGSGEFIKVGPELARVNGQAPEIRATFSPDGTQLLVTYDDGSAWLYPVSGGPGVKADWAGLIYTSWQRLPLQQ